MIVNRKQGIFGRACSMRKKSKSNFGIPSFRFSKTGFFRIALPRGFEPLSSRQVGMSYASNPNSLSIASRFFSFFNLCSSRIAPRVLNVL